MEVNVTVNLGERTLSFGENLLKSLLKPRMILDAGVSEIAAKSEPEPEKKEAQAPAKTAKTAKPEATAKTAKAEATGFGSLDDDAKLEAIKSEVTKHAKKGKSADIKTLLSKFDAGRASELSAECYDSFYDAITRYGKGESIEEIFPEELD